MEIRPSIKVDPLGVTAPDAFAETANAESRVELERAIAAYDAKKRGGHSAATQAMKMPTSQPSASPHQSPAPSAAASPPVSPKAASHVAPVQQPRTAAMPASVARVPSAPSVPVAASHPSPSASSARGPSPQARVPLAPGSSGGLPAAAPSVVGNPSPVPFPQPIRGPGSPPPPLAPGLPVNVMWANGQRYRGTIVQLLGPRVLVVFPDGQQHWVEMGYITPA